MLYFPINQSTFNFMFIGMGNTIPGAEFNFRCDPEAAFIVLENSQCPIYVAPWELCLKNEIPSVSISNNKVGSKTPMAK